MKQGKTIVLTAFSFLALLSSLGIYTMAQQTTQAPPTPIAPAAGVFKFEDVVKKGLTKAPDARGNFATSLVGDWATGRAIVLSFNTIKTHRHTDHSHVLYILEGRAKFTVDKEVLEAGPGDIVTMPPLLPHKFEAIGEQPVKAFLVNVSHVSVTNSTWDE